MGMVWSGVDYNIILLPSPEIQPGFNPEEVQWIFSGAKESSKIKSSILPTESLGGTGLILIAVQMSAVGQPTLGKTEVYSAAAARSRDGPADPRSLLPRTEALSLGSPAEVPAMSLWLLRPRPCLDSYSSPAERQRGCAGECVFSSNE
ncbi:unnamed protein product [Pleuronectes platessa]|uniref:Uncharacterized protein n=1 Tax=Pleuronectes platessa TaxID=8262 RepID=A0A9N7UUN9_PLEPL|nr:unnamed protein product [Pleuronectes platessa]